MVITCSICNVRGFTTLLNFLEHVKGHCSKDFDCGSEQCTLTLTSMWNLKRHMLGKHLSEFTGECTTACPPDVAVQRHLIPETPHTEECAQSSDCNNEAPPPEPAAGFDFAQELDDYLLKFMCDIGKNPTITNVTIDQVMTGTNCLINNILDLINNNLVKAVEELGLADSVHKSINSIIECEISKNVNPLSKYRTTKLRQSLLKSKGLYHEPQLTVMGGPVYEPIRKNFSTAVTNVRKYDRSYSFDIGKTLLKILDNPAIQEKLVWPNASESELLEHCFDGKRIKDLYRRIGKPFLVIELYYDEFEPGNPLGAKAAINKIGNFYICLRNLPNYFNSCGANIHLVNIGYSGDFKKHGYDVVLGPIWTQLAALEDGIEVNLSCGTLVGKHTLPVVLGSVVGDNLAVHQVTGFKECFRAHKFCRSCLLSYSDINNFQNRDELMLRDATEHDTVAKTLTPESSKANEINFFSPLNKLKYFHVTDNPGADIVHDFQEGIIPLELGRILCQLVFEERHFTVYKLNSLIRRFPYGGRPNPRNHQ